jgi:LacI family transcriptional regulator
MQDVARLAGVSQTTVSFVVNDTPNANIPQETRERVLAAVKELGYRPNAIARGLRARSTETIGFISDEVATTPYAGQIIQGAQDLAWQYQKVLLLISTGGHRDMKQAAIDIMLDRQVDGILYATMYHRPAHPPEAIHQLPAVLLDCFVADGSLPSVVPDEVGGGRLATTYLLDKGHRRIGYLNNVDPIPATAGRLEGYRQALAHYDVPFDESLVYSAKSDSAGGYDGTMALMQRSDRPTALFCFTDRMAMGAYDALRQLGLAIPGDVAVVGFDNIELIAAHLYPPLTTVALPHYEMGQWAVQHLIQLIEEPETRQAPPLHHTVAGPLIERTSA